jgi:hypothetical protein
MSIIDDKCELNDMLKRAYKTARHVVKKPSSEAYSEIDKLCDRIDYKKLYDILITKPKTKLIENLITYFKEEGYFYGLKDEKKATGRLVRKLVKDKISKSELLNLVKSKLGISQKQNSKSEGLKDLVRVNAKRKRDYSSEHDDIIDRKVCENSSKSNIVGIDPELYEIIYKTFGDSSILPQQLKVVIDYLISNLNLNKLREILSSNENNFRPVLLDYFKEIFSNQATILSEMVIAQITKDIDDVALMTYLNKELEIKKAKLADEKEEIMHQLANYSNLQGMFDELQFECDKLRKEKEELFLENKAFKVKINKYRKIFDKIQSACEKTEDD